MLIPATHDTCFSGDNTYYAREDLRYNHLEKRKHLCIEIRLKSLFLIKIVSEIKLVLLISQ